MAEQEPTAEQLAQIAAENEEDEHSVNYKPPAQKSIQEIQELDKDDESLRKYKEALLGRVAVSADPNVPNVVVTRLTLVCSTAPGPLELDLTGGWCLLVASLKNKFSDSGQGIFMVRSLTCKQKGCRFYPQLLWGVHVGGNQSMCFSNVHACLSLFFPPLLLFFHYL